MARETDLRSLLDLDSFLERSVEYTNTAAALALNGVLGGPRGLGAYRKAIKAQINFPAGYLDDSKRFGMGQHATADNLVASLVARQRPTSLARFATSGAAGTKGVSVHVKSGGGTKTFKSGFLVRLRAGTEDGGNLGLAVRLAPGQTLNKKDQSRMVHLEANVVLLYGPSIDQVLNNTVAESETPEVVDNIETEFFRQFARLSSGH